MEAVEVLFVKASHEQAKVSRSVDVAADVELLTDHFGVEFGVQGV